MAILGDAPVRRARADRRSLGQGSPPPRRAGPLRARRGGRATGRARHPHLVRPRRPWRRDGRRTCAAAGRQRRVLPPRDGEWARASATRGRALGRAEATNHDPIGLLIVSGDEAAANPGRARARRARRARPRDLDVPRPRRRLGGSRPARNELPRARRDVRQPRGPASSACAARSSHPRRTSSPGSRSSPSVSTSSSRPIPRSVFEEVSAIAFGGIPFGEIGEHAPLPLPDRRRRADRRAAGARARTARDYRLVRYRPLFSGPAVERVPELQFQRPLPEVELPEQDARERGIRNGDEVTIRSNGTSVTLRARLSARAALGRRFASPRTTQATCSRRWRSRSDGALVDLADQIGGDRQPRHGRVRVHDLARAQAARPDAEPLRAEPRRPVTGCCSLSPI